MPTEIVVWGPPGTGKTSLGEAVVGESSSRGVRRDEIAYLAFTRQAALEALSRVLEASGVGEAEDYPYFRTIHSLCYQGVRSTRSGVKVVTGSDLKRFSAEVGWEANFAVDSWEDLADVYLDSNGVSRPTPWDKAFQAYKLSRLSATSISDLNTYRHSMSKLAATTLEYVPGDVYETFVRKYEAFKARHGLIDFTDMLEFGLVSMPPLHGIRIVVVDEAQDLCPIHYALIDRLFPDAEQIWWIGDDDQAIYRFAGAKADLFLERARRASCQIQLRQTHRFGQGIVDFAARVIRRVSLRQPKDVIGAAGRSGAIYRIGTFRPVGGGALILHRHVAGCQRIAQRYMDAGIPFRNERGQDPLGATNRVNAWKALHLLASGHRAPLSGIAALIGDLMPSIHSSADGVKTRLVVHGGKSKLTESREQSVSLQELESGGILTPEGAAAIRHRAYDLLKHADDLYYYQRVVDNGYSLNGPPEATICTIHGKKGAQAPHVIIFSEMTRKCWTDRDTEHRLAYVAVTRTQGDVGVCGENLLEHANSRYEYPDFA